MARKLSFDERLSRMSDTELPNLCRAIRDAIPSIATEHDRDIELPNDLDSLLRYKRLSTATWELITHARNVIGGSERAGTLNSAGKRAIKILDEEIRRRAER